MFRQPTSAKLSFISALLLVSNAATLVARPPVIHLAAQMNTRNSFGPIGLDYGSNIYSAGPWYRKIS